MLNLDAELAENLKVYSDYTKSRAAVNYPAKMDVPMVWDRYLDTARPVGDGLSTGQAAYTPALPDYEAAGFAEASPAPVGWRVSGDGEGGLLGQLNDRLKTQAQRYPHPITNEMEDFS